MALEGFSEVYERIAIDGHPQIIGLKKDDIGRVVMAAWIDHPNLNRFVSTHEVLYDQNGRVRRQIVFHTKGEDDRLSERFWVGDYVYLDNGFFGMGRYEPELGKLKLKTYELAIPHKGHKPRVVFHRDLGIFIDDGYSILYRVSQITGDRAVVVPHEVKGYPEFEVASEIKIGELFNPNTSVSKK